MMAPLSSASLSACDYLVIGHVTHDLLPGGQGFTIGGTATYSGLVAAALGRRVGILTSAGADCDVAPFGAGPFGERVAVHCHRGAHTTTFENRYTPEGRVQLLHQIADLLTPELVPPEWETSPIVHIGPVAAECAPELATHFAGRAFVGLTPQGWMRRRLRQRDAQDQVVARPWHEAEALLPLASAVVLSMEDVRGDRDLAERWAALTRYLVLTDGYMGGTLYCDGRPYLFPALRVTEVDPTGAGDIFAATFFCALADGTDPRLAAHLAACIASRSIERAGWESVPTPEDRAVCNWDWR